MSRRKKKSAPRNAVKVTYADGRVEVRSPRDFRKMSRGAELAAARRTPHWRALRKKALERDDHRCTQCRKTEKLEVHHLTYARLWKELLEDVVTLCQRCHATEHQWQRRRGGR